MIIKYALFDCWDTVIRFNLKKPHADLEIIYSHVVNKEKCSFNQICQDSHEFLTDYYSTTPFDVRIEAIVAYIFESRGLILDCSYEKACREASEGYDSPLMAHLKEFVGFLKENGVGCAVLSNTVQSQEGTQAFIEKAWPDHPFDRIIASSSYAVKKPDPRFFRLGLLKAGASAENTIFIGDNIYTDIKGATAAGLTAFWYNWRGRRLPDELADEVRFTEFSDYLELKKILERGDAYVLG